MGLFVGQEVNLQKIFSMLVSFLSLSADCRLKDIFSKLYFLKIIFSQVDKWRFGGLGSKRCEAGEVYATMHCCSVIILVQIYLD